jgi:hypothetical protein
MGTALVFVPVASRLMILDYSFENNFVDAVGGRSSSAGRPGLSSIVANILCGVIKY